MGWMDPMTFLTGQSGQVRKGLFLVAELLPCVSGRHSEISHFICVVYLCTNLALHLGNEHVK